MQKGGPITSLNKRHNNFFIYKCKVFSIPPFKGGFSETIKFWSYCVFFMFTTFIDGNGVPPTHVRGSPVPLAANATCKFKEEIQCRIAFLTTVVKDKQLGFEPYMYFLISSMSCFDYIQLEYIFTWEVFTILEICMWIKRHKGEYICSLHWIFSGRKTSIMTFHCNKLLWVYYYYTLQWGFPPSLRSSIVSWMQTILFSDDANTLLW